MSLQDAAGLLGVLVILVAYAGAALGKLDPERPISLLCNLTGACLILWSLLTGVMEVIAAVPLRKIIAGEWLLALSGVLSIAFGVLLALFPAPGALAVVLWIGAYAIVFGCLLIALGLRLRSWQHHGTAHPATAAA